MKADEVREHLRRIYNRPESAIMFEVTDGLGRGRRTGRLADAIAVSFWESRGLYIEGLEIKVSRSDWQRELQMPAKADAHFVRCDHWWLVTPQKKGHETPIAKIEEIPGPWGWMEITAKGEQVIRKKAPTMIPPVQFEKRFAFALIRAAVKGEYERIEREVKRRVAAEKGDFTESVNRAASLLVKPANDTADAELMTALREAFGPSIAWLAKPKVVAAIKSMRAINEGRTHADFASAAKRLRDAADLVDRADDAFHSLMKEGI